MKILVIGNRKHQLLCNLLTEIKQVYGSNELLIDVFSQDVIEQQYDTDVLFRSIFTLKMPVILGKIRLLRGILKQVLFRRQLTKLESYDFIHVHYLEDIIIRDAVFFLKHLSGQLIVSLWGSDFLRASDEKKKKMTAIFLRASKITIANEEAKDLFLNFYSGYNFDDKVVLCRFFIKPLDLLRGHLNNINKKECKALLGLEHKIVVTVGYNASQMQQHMAILNSIESSPNLIKWKEKLIFLLPLTYPKNTVYLNEIQQFIDNSKFEYKIYKDFMTEETLCHLRIASDIMIQLQTSDMMSASMLEHIYASNIVITGSWLPYKLLKNWGLYFMEVDYVYNVAALLALTLTNYNAMLSNTENNSRVLEREFDRDILISKWIKLYQ